MSTPAEQPPSTSRRPPRRRSRLAGEHPAWAATVAGDSVDSSHAVDSAGDPSNPATAVPMPPPRRRRTVRVQLNTRVAQELHERLASFVEQHDAAVQDVVETALTEYLDRRGG